MSALWRFLCFGILDGRMCHPLRVFGDGCTVSKGHLGYFPIYKQPGLKALRVTAKYRCQRCSNRSIVSSNERISAVFSA
ncbi:hypothetical protein C8J56DRAFT_946959 [Mycena floridula]|nr:hypothetical protein C8J56DRAFT_946959 [Mycena floridula]